jgi:flagellar protein FlbD
LHYEYSRARRLAADISGRTGGITVIELTRLNGQKLFVNCDLLKCAESSPDTVLTLLTGDKIVVRESCEQVIALALSFRARILGTAWPDAAAALGALLTQFGLNAPQPGSHR